MKIHEYQAKEILRGFGDHRIGSAYNNRNAIGYGGDGNTLEKARIWG